MRAVVLVALLLPLAGCLGVPDDAVGFGDTVFAAVTVYPAGNDTAIQADRPVNFAVGSGGSGFNADFERAFLGHKQGEAFRIDLAPMEFRGEVARERFFGTDPANPILLAGQIERDRFEGAFGPATPGMEFTPPLSFYPYRVDDVDESNVYYTALPEDGQRNNVTQVGSVLVTHVEGDRMIQELDPIIGATFAVAPPTPFQPETPLGLDPGSYLVTGKTDTQILLAYHPSQSPDLVGQGLRIEVQLNSIQKSTQDGRAPVDGNFGVRQSPQVNGRPSAEPYFGPHEMIAEAMDGMEISEPEPGHEDPHH